MRPARRRASQAKRPSRREESSGADLARRRTPAPWVPLAALILLGAALYANTLHHPFVFDDHSSIVDNPQIQSLWPPARALSAPPGTGANGRPVVALSLALNYAVSGLHVWSYHLFNVAMHVATALLLFAFLRSTLLLPRIPAALGSVASPAAFSVALLWLVHPLQTAAINHVIYRSDILAAFFTLLTLYAALRAAEAATSRPWEGVSFLACALGMASKEVMVVTPLLAFLYDGVFLSGTLRQAWRRHRRLFLLLGSTWTLLALLVVTADRGSTVGFDVQRVSWFEYALTQSQVVLTYMRLVLWPRPLVLHYDWEIVRSVHDAWKSLVLLALILGITLWMLRSRRLAGYPLAWFFLLLAPTSSIVPLTGMVAAEHRTYLALAGPLTLGVCSFFWMAARRGVTRMGMVLLLPLAAASLLALQTLQRNRDYRTEITLWEDVVAKRPRNARAQANLAGAYVAEGRYEEALLHYRQALRLQPRHVETLAHVAGALLHLGRFEEAVPAYERAIQLGNETAETEGNLASALTRLGRFAEAREHLRRAETLEPGLAVTRYHRARLELTQGNLDSAIVFFEAAVGKSPSFVEAHRDLAAALLRRGDPQGALAEYGTALRLEPEDIGTLNNVAWLLATSPDPDARDSETALRHIERALALQGSESAELLDTRAAALAAAGRFEMATQTASRARQLAETSGDENLAARIASRLELYRRGIAYHRPAASGREATPTEFPGTKGGGEKNRDPSSDGPR